MRRYEITDQEWALLTPLPPGEMGDIGRISTNNCLFINAIAWIDRSGAPWLDLPELFGVWNSVYRRFRGWAKTGVWKNLFEHLQEPDLDWSGSPVRS